MKSKVIKTSSFPDVAKGGSGKMFGKGSVGPQKPGRSATGGAPGGGKFAKGGSASMCGYSGAKPAKKR